MGGGKREKEQTWKIKQNKRKKHNDERKKPRMNDVLGDDDA